jgi:hypothetical protein
VTTYVVKVWRDGLVGAEESRADSYEAARARLDGWLSDPSRGVSRWEIWERVEPQKLAEGGRGAPAPVADRRPVAPPKAAEAGFRVWVPVARQLPPEGAIVLTRIDDARGVRSEQELKRQGRLWLVPDGSVYVYYTPTHWREAAA